jgi:hypothetical protein
MTQKILKGRHVNCLDRKEKFCFPTTRHLSTPPSSSLLVALHGQALLTLLSSSPSSSILLDCTRYTGSIGTRSSPEQQTSQGKRVSTS